MKKRASIDLGTNTCLLLIAEMDQETHRVLRVIEDRSSVVRLGEGVDRSGVLSDAAMRRTDACLTSYLEIIKREGIDPASVRAVATSSARDAKNASAFFEGLEQRLGFRFRVLSGEQEAEASFLGALLPGLEPSKSWVIDIGGGSTEFVSQSGALSIDMGAVRFYERYFANEDPPSDTRFRAAVDAVDVELKKVDPELRRMARETLVGVAGTVTTLAALYHRLKTFDAQKVDSTELRVEELQRIVMELKRRSPAERLEMPGVQPGREDVLLAGALILWRSLQYLQIASIRVSSRGLRYGVLMIE